MLKIHPSLEFQVINTELFASLCAKVDWSTVRKTFAPHVCMFIPFLTVSFLFEVALTNWTSPAASRNSISSIFHKIFHKRCLPLASLDDYLGEGDLDRLILISRHSKIEKTHWVQGAFSLSCFSCSFTLFFLYAVGEGCAATNWGKLDCVTSPSALADRPGGKLKSLLCRESIEKTNSSTSLLKRRRHAQKSN